jgi:hypothetical protein
MLVRKLLGPTLVRWGIGGAICTSMVACLVISRGGVAVERMDKDAAQLTDRDVVVRSPVKAHLVDGSTVLFRDGVVVSKTSVRTRGKPGERFDVRLSPIPAVQTILLDSIVGMENFISRTNIGTSTVLTVLATTGMVIGGALAAVAIFGSCPTVYADSAGTAVLQAEVFANRISPLFEARDIDLLSIRADSAGIVRLEVRNEALETHYINQFELLDVRHGRDERIVPDEHGRPLALDAFAAATEARDRAGNDLRSTLESSDGVVFSTATSTMMGVTENDARDYIDFTVKTPRDAENVAVVMHLRNSLLNTVLLYDFMLGAPGARSLDWLAHDMYRIGPVLQLGRWYRNNFGLRILVKRGDKYEEVERHPTYGPVAWRDVATMVPVRGQDELQIRLTFVADEWRIDKLAVATRARRVESRVVGLTRVDAGDDTTSSSALRSMREPDERYLQTSPGQKFTIAFDVGQTPASEARTFLLASQGYYTEWLRGSWIKASRDSIPFKPGNAMMVGAIRRWYATRDSVEKLFYGARIPVSR